MRSCFLLFFLFLAFSSVIPGQADDGSSWRGKLKEQLPLLGHRNWIAIVDSAYPAQVTPGVQTIFCDDDQTEVVKAVLQLLDQSKSVKPMVYTDLELNAVPEEDAPGIGRYRSQLTKVLNGRHVEVLPHEQIIAKLDEAGKVFRVIILKTHLTLPYTSVFLQLECGYWNANAEARLRHALANRPATP